MDILSQAGTPLNNPDGAPVNPAVRHWRPVVLVLLAPSLAVLAVAASQEPSFGWDRALAAWLLGFSTPAYDAFMEAVSFPGEYAMVIVTMLMGAALAAWRLGWRAGLLVVVGLGVMGLNEAFKDVVDRPRPLEDPTGGGESFPSGHTMHAILTSGLLWLLVAPKLKALSHRRVLLVAVLVWPVLVGVSRVHLERHWPSDVLGAYLFGAAVIIAMAWVWPRLQQAAFPLLPTPGEGPAGESAP
ncbi:MAG: phosphatase PAP2 family protein [Chloroflexota bacterium]|nr:phosphatase PAP2 family protein [Chloroflexota bacterium]MDE2968839.1 phosphatase PAP2 family protein [Chloroflexota bacterium]